MLSMDSASLCTVSTNCCCSSILEKTTLTRSSSAANLAAMPLSSCLSCSSIGYSTSVFSASIRRAASLGKVSSRPHIRAFARRGRPRVLLHRRIPPSLSRYAIPQNRVLPRDLPGGTGEPWMRAESRCIRFVSRARHKKTRERPAKDFRLRQGAEAKEQQRCVKPTATRHWAKRLAGPLGFFEECSKPRFFGGQLYSIPAYPARMILTIPYCSYIMGAKRCGKVFVTKRLLIRVLRTIPHMGAML